MVPNQEAFVIYVATLSSEMAIYSARQAQIASLKVRDALVTVPAEYLDFANIFSEKLAVVLLGHIEINNHAINLEKGK